MLLNVGDTVQGSNYEVVREFDRQGCMSRMYVIRNQAGIEQLLKVNISHREYKEIGFDSKTAYNGKLVFNVTAGAVESYTEEMDSTWTVVDPFAEKQTDQPDTIIMGAKRSYHFEKMSCAD